VVFLLVIAQEPGHKFRCNAPNIYLVTEFADSFHMTVWQFHKHRQSFTFGLPVLPLALLPHFWSWFLPEVIKNVRHRQLISVLFWELKPFVGLVRSTALSTDASLSISCFCCHLTEFETESNANSLFLHKTHFNEPVHSQNSTNTVLKLI
jgi:hypothetical protein